MNGPQLTVLVRVFPSFILCSGCHSMHKRTVDQAIAQKPKKIRVPFLKIQVQAPLPAESPLLAMYDHVNLDSLCPTHIIEGTEAGVVGKSITSK